MENMKSDVHKMTNESGREAEKASSSDTLVSFDASAGVERLKLSHRQIDIINAGLKLVLSDTDDAQEHAAAERLLMMFGDPEYADAAKLDGAIVDETPREAVERIVHMRGNLEGRVYVAGPMTGLPDHNFPAFNCAADKLRGQGWHVENPAEHGLITGAVWADYLRWDISRLATCGAIYLLPGWETSKGALLEVSIGQALGVRFVRDANAVSPMEVPAVQSAGSVSPVSKAAPASAFVAAPVAAPIPPSSFTKATWMPGSDEAAMRDLIENISDWSPRAGVSEEGLMAKFRSNAQSLLGMSNSGRSILRENWMCGSAEWAMREFVKAVASWSPSAGVAPELVLSQFRVGARSLLKACDAASPAATPGPRVTPAMQQSLADAQAQVEESATRREENMEKLTSKSGLTTRTEVLTFKSTLPPPQR